MWSSEFVRRSTASPSQVFDVLAKVEQWPEWNEGVARVEMHGPFEAGTTAVMVLPDGESFPFTFAWVDAGKGFEDITEIPDTGLSVRVSHELFPEDGGTKIVYRCKVDGPDAIAAEVGHGVSADFDTVIAALAARAEGADA